jgi:hypothetical protein
VPPPNAGAASATPTHAVGREAKVALTWPPVVIFSFILI